jgi:hypothetical protein
MGPVSTSSGPFVSGLAVSASALSEGLPGWTQSSSTLVQYTLRSTSFEMDLRTIGFDTPVGGEVPPPAFALRQGFVADPAA